MPQNNSQEKPAPVSNVVKKTIMCVGVLYQDKNFGVTLGKCRTSARELSSFYKKNSCGKLIIVPKCAVVKVPFTGHPKNVNKTRQYVLKKYPGFDMYAIVLSCISVSNAGNGVANLQNFLARDWQHEVGHLLGLEHAGAYVGGKLEPYGDALSVMGKFPSGFLTVCQYQFKKWFSNSEFANYDGVGTKTFTVKRVTMFGAPGIAGVIFKKDGRNAFVSFPQSTGYFGSRPYLALHLQMRGGSQKVASFEKEYYDDRFTGLHIKIVSKTATSVTFTLDLNQKSIDYVPELEEEQDLSIVYPSEHDDDDLESDLGSVEIENDPEDVEDIEDIEEDQK